MIEMYLQFICHKYKTQSHQLEKHLESIHLPHLVALELTRHPETHYFMYEVDQHS